MSEKNVPNLSQGEIEKILKLEDTAVLCTALQNEPYGVPISYALLDGKIVFHCAIKGRKLDIIRKNPAVHLIVFRHPDGIAPHPEGDCKYRFESVFITGKACIIEDVSDRLVWLKRFKKYFDERLNLPLDENPVTEKAAEICGCVVIEIEQVSGRKKG
ncbi:MAG: pyridoxamine 5'-phosphate oxidase family protein [Candidatus Riflebacteria bacterium]|nr:pyridoxamine 5'-phosphate oxidase family protein [Candidatus Riflebacteria bacterium]